MERVIRRPGFEPVRREPTWTGLSQPSLPRTLIWLESYGRRHIPGRRGRMQVRRRR